jgi:hypothetical protein
MQGGLALCASRGTASIGTKDAPGGADGGDHDRPDPGRGVMAAAWGSRQKALQTYCLTSLRRLALRDAWVGAVIDWRSRSSPGYPRRHSLARPRPVAARRGWAAHPGGWQRGRGPRRVLLALRPGEATLDGEEPDGVSLEKVYRMPVEWEAQRRVVGERLSPRRDARGGAALSHSGGSSRAQEGPRS